MKKTQSGIHLTLIFKPLHLCSTLRYYFIVFTISGKEAMKKILFLSAILLSASSVCFSAPLSTMNKSATSAALTDKTITTISAATLNRKIISDSFTGYFGKDGKMKGTFANKPADSPQTDQGTWKINSDGKVCVTWEHWNDGKQYCVVFYKLNNALLIVNAANNDFESLVLN
ncbi:MAG TPA: hypothetical protein VLG50_07115, partial [Candidatus Saccharimonadales bacterium]|nr:hypothetical protein [Candidatus Saccharimonadales bacterium]